MAQGVTPTRITPAIMPSIITHIAIIGTSQRLSRWERGVARMQAGGFADANASFSPNASVDRMQP